MFRNGGYVRAMQEGGDPMMAPPMPEQAPPMLPISSALPTGASVSMEQAAAGAAQQGVDPTVLGSMLEQASGMITNLDAAADTGDYEQIINAIRGDEMPLQERRQELAGVVGDADAAQTPDSVLTLLQPIMQLTAVDQGIGGLASETMNTPVTGDMAGGIMSTVNMAEEAPMPGQGGPAPVNFNQGGAVQYMAEGGAAEPNKAAGGAAKTNRFQEIFDIQRPLYRSILNSEEEAAALDEQKRMTQAQMLFDVAQGGLLFAAGAGKPGGTPAEQLAAAFVEPLGNISARAGEFQKYKDAQRKDTRTVDLAALDMASQLYGSELDAEARSAAALSSARSRGRVVSLMSPEGETLHPGLPMVDAVAYMDQIPGSYLADVETPGERQPKFMVATDTRTGESFTFDAESPEGLSLINRVNNANNTAGSTIFSITNVGTNTTADSMTVYLPKEERSAISLDGGRTILNPDGSSSPMPPTAVPLSAENAWDTISKIRTQTAAGQRLEAMSRGAPSESQQPLSSEDPSETLRGGTAEKPKPLSAEDRAAAYDVIKAAREGTGTWAMIRAGVENVVGGVMPGDGIIFPDTAESRQIVKGLNVLLRSALVVNNRYPVAEMENVAKLFPSVDSFFANPEVEAQKYVQLYDLTRQLTMFNLQKIRDGGLDDATLSHLRSHVTELDRLGTMLESVTRTIPTGANATAMDSLQNLVEQSQR
jgi:hypothetical protein